MRHFERSLIKLVEECSEVQIEALKTVSFGPESRWPDDTAPSNKEKLITELGDLLAMIDVVCNEIGLDISEEELHIAKLKKMKKLETYLPHISS